VWTDNWDPTTGDDNTTLDIPEDLKDGYTSGETFYYVLTIENPGAGDADDVLLTGQLTNSRVTLDTGKDIYAWDNGALVAPAVQPTSSTSFSFGPYDLAAGNKLVVAIPATANTAGTVNFDSELT